MNISQYIRYAVLLQEATIARHPNKQMQTQKDLKKKKKKITIFVTLQFWLQNQSQ